MKTKIYLLFIFLLSGLFFVNAQQHQGQMKRFNVEEYKQKRNDYIIKEVGLTSEEAKQFFPLCDEFMRKKYELNKDARKEGRELLEKKNASNSEYETLIDKTLDIRIKEAQLEKEYYEKFKKVLSPEKLYKYLRAEIRFTRSFFTDRDRTNK